MRIKNSEAIAVATTPYSDFSGVPAVSKDPGPCHEMHQIPPNLLAPDLCNLFVVACSPQREFYQAIDQAIVSDVLFCGSLKSSDSSLGFIAQSFNREETKEARDG